jgi:hypothetical protein
MTSSATWEGVVELVRKDSFVARVTEVRHGRSVNGASELTVFDKSDLQYESETDLVEPGAVFYWTVGRATNKAGSMSKASIVRFKRIPTGSKDAERDAEVEASRLFEELGFEEN